MQLREDDYSNLGFDFTKNYPEGFILNDEQEEERKMNLEIIKDNGEII